MRKTILTCLLWCLACLAYAQAPFKRKAIPNEWVEKIQKYDYKERSAVLLRDFKKYIAPYQIAWSNKDDGLNVLWVDLDSDASEEIVMLMGGDRVDWATPKTLCVLKQTNQKWELVYHEKLPKTFTSLQVISTFSREKIFYIRTEETGLFETNTGRRVDHIFYRLVAGEIKPCLKLLHKLDLVYTPWVAEQDVAVDFTLFEDYFWVTYECDYHIKTRGEDVSMFRLQAGVKYAWNDTQKEYLPVFTNTFTQPKLLALIGFEGFEQSFAEEVRKAREQGTEHQKRAFAQYDEDKKKPR